LTDRLPRISNHSRSTTASGTSGLSQHIPLGSEVWPPAWAVYVSCCTHRPWVPCACATQCVMCVSCRGHAAHVWVCGQIGHVWIRHSELLRQKCHRRNVGHPCLAPNIPSRLEKHQHYCNIIVFFLTLLLLSWRATMPLVPLAVPAGLGRRSSSAKSGAKGAKRSLR
jgi:hypothetical protein